MARLYIDKTDIASRTTWFYVLMTKAPVEIFEFNGENEEMMLENPLQSHPLLVDGKVRVWGSVAAILYVAERFNKFEGIGNTIEQRAKNESVLSWASGALFRSVAINFVAPQLYEEDALPGEAKDAQIEFGKAATCEQLDTMETAYFQKTKYIAGSNPSFIDFYVGIVLSVLDKIDFDLSGWPKTQVWYSDMKQRTHVMIKNFQEQESQSSKKG